MGVFQDIKYGVRMLAGYSSGPAQSVATESDANLGANSAKLSLGGPLMN